MGANYIEDQLPPSTQTLRLHWLRTLWVVEYWSQACQSQMSLLPLQWFGWRLQSDAVSVEWDSEENVEQVRQRVSFLTHGCSCKTGCSTRRCKCVKAGQRYGYDYFWKGIDYPRFHIICLPRAFVVRPRHGRASHVSIFHLGLIRGARAYCPDAARRGAVGPTHCWSHCPPPSCELTCLCSSGIAPHV